MNIPFKAWVIVQLLSMLGLAVAAVLSGGSNDRYVNILLGVVIFNTATITVQINFLSKQLMTATLFISKELADKTPTKD